MSKAKNQSLTNKKQEKVYGHWNGKNINGTDTVGDADLVPQARNTQKLAKYDVSNETVSADNLQKEPTATNKTDYGNL